MPTVTSPRAVLTAACVAIASAAWVLPARADAGYGEALVRANCARCHAVAADDGSTHPEAPPFRDLHLRYPLEALEEAFAEGISTGHPDMPQFVATPEQIAAIIDYIAGLAP